MKVKIGVSNRHVHLTHDDYVLLFGNETIKKERDLVQKGQFASSSKVTIKTDKTGLLDVEKLDSCYKYGYNAVTQNIEKIKQIIFE